MKVYYKARVIHDVENDQYVVETKKRWYSPWEHQRSYSRSPHTSLEWCKEQAVTMCNGLVQQAVIYEVKK